MPEKVNSNLWQMIDETEDRIDQKERELFPAGWRNSLYAFFHPEEQKQKVARLFYFIIAEHSALTKKIKERNLAHQG